MDFLKCKVESILLDPYLSKEDFIKCYNIIFIECSRPSNKEINGKDLYNLLKEIFESHFKKENHSSFENFKENITQYKKAIILIKNLFQYLERYFIFINVEQNNYNIMYLDQLFYNAYYDFYFKKHEKGFIDFFFEEKNLILFYTELLRLNNKRAELSEFENYFILKTLQSIDYALPIEKLICIIYEKIKRARQIFNISHMEDMVKTIYRNFKSKTHLLIDLIIKEVQNNSNGSLIRKCAYVLRELEGHETFLVLFYEKFEEMLVGISDLKMHYEFFIKIHKSLYLLFKEEKYQADITQIFHRQTHFQIEELANFFISQFTERTDLNFLSQYLKMINNENLNQEIYKRVQVGLLDNQFNVQVLIRFTSYFDYTCVYIHKIWKVTEDILNQKRYRTLRMPFWSLRENTNRLLSNECNILVSNIQLPNDMYRKFQIAYQYSAVEVKINNAVLRCSLADADILFYIMQNKIREEDLNNYALDNLFMHKIIYKNKDGYLCMHNLHKNLNILKYSLRSDKNNNKIFADIENIKMRSFLMKILKQEKKIKKVSLFERIEDREQGEIAIGYLLKKKYIEEKDNFYFYRV